MKIKSVRNNLSGKITVPGSKSHTIRALMLSCLADGTSRISNPLPSADCISAANAIPLMGARINFGEGKEEKVWTVSGAGKNIHLPSDVVNVGDSGSLLYFMSPIAATFEGASIFTGDESLRRRPVYHVADVLNQLGANAFCAVPGTKTCPFVVQGPITADNTVHTEGSISSQYISGLMMAAMRLKGTLKIELTNPKETPYLTMTKIWLEEFGAKVKISDDFKHIEVTAPNEIKAKDFSIPSDWEAVAFPLVAALITDSEITIENIDCSGSQGDDKIVEVLQSVGADIEWDKNKAELIVRGGSKSRLGNKGRLSAEALPSGELHVNLSGFPDAICAVSVAACFIEGKTYIEDIAVCRRKETDRIKVLKKELKKLGAVVEEGDDFMVIHGHSPILKDGSANKDFALHGGIIESYDDHRVAMSLACMGLAIQDANGVVVNDAECCAVSFPDFFNKMNQALNAGFAEV